MTVQSKRPIDIANKMKKMLNVLVVLLMCIMSRPPSTTELVQDLINEINQVLNMGGSADDVDLEEYYKLKVKLASSFPRIGREYLKLSKKLEIAVEALEEIGNSDWDACHECEGRCELVSKAEEALQKINQS